MTNQVLYLCQSATTKKGWVFPREEDDCYFPGVFVIEEHSGKLADQYWFEAFNKDKKMTLSLQKKERQIFVTHSPVGTFFFRARHTKERYVGKHLGLQQHHPFWLLEALHPNRLEEACQQADFYFVGAGETTLDGDENSPHPGNSRR